MNTELQAQTVHIIQSLHERAQAAADDSKHAAIEALKAATECGMHLDELKRQTKGQFLGFLRDNIPNLTPERAKAYVSLFHSVEERETQAIDHRQLLLLGVVDKGDSDCQERPTPGLDAGRWVSWVGNIRGWFSKTTRERPVERWSPEERQSVRDQLKPLVELYEMLQ